MLAWCQGGAFEDVFVVTVVVATKFEATSLGHRSHALFSGWLHNQPSLGFSPPCWCQVNLQFWGTKSSIHIIHDIWNYGFVRKFGTPFHPLSVSQLPCDSIAMGDTPRGPSMPFSFLPAPGSRRKKRLRKKKKKKKKHFSSTTLSSVLMVKTYCGG